MKKNEEREKLPAILKNETLIDSERPDFVSTDRKIGIEITELYRSPLHAKLEKVKGYAEQIIEGKHPEKKYFDVEPIKIGENTCKCILLKETNEEHYKLLKKTIHKKESNLINYQQKATLIDLVIVDSENIFWKEATPENYNERADLIYWLANNLDTKFSEIWIVAKDYNIPVILNLLLYNIDTGGDILINKDGVAAKNRWRFSADKGIELKREDANQSIFIIEKCSEKKLYKGKTILLSNTFKKK